MFSNWNIRFLSYSKNVMRAATIELDQKLIENIEKQIIKPKNHPGINKNRCVTLPKNILNGISKAIGDFPSKTLHTDGASLSRYLTARHIPPEENLIKNKHQEIQKKILEQLGTIENMMNEIEIRQKQQSIDNKVQKALNQNIYSWKPMVYDAYKSLQYLVGRSAQEYSVLLKIFSEISLRNANFKPRSFFDFGSGVGTGFWAVTNVWNNTIYEYFLVDSSREMNDLADLVLREGNENKQIKQQKLYFRQFLPATTVKYDIVLSAYSLFELPSSGARQEVLINLWNKCDGYLVIVEQGTNAGFSLINEAKEFILSHSKLNNEDVHVFAPCPHEVSCPRIKKNDGTPCNFSTSYYTVALEGTTKISQELYSYVVLQKGRRNVQQKMDDWPRIVRPTLVRTKHTVCRMCNSNGHLQEVVFTASKHGKKIYRCARSSKWGDRLPITIINDLEEENLKL